ncbi:MAG: sugar transferase [Parachlamydiaceae bacterium]
MEDVTTRSPSAPVIPIHLPIDCKIKHIPIKRCFDLFFSLFLLIVGSPFFLLIGLIIFLTSPGPIIYSHERVGRGGKCFRCYKFRSMYSDADKKLKDILDRSPQLREEWEKTYKLKNDPRVTPFGSFLRRTSLDEVPQFWNVLKGDLSIVGPRPVLQEEINKYYHLKAYKILSIRPGLTGIWQVSGRNDVQSYENRVMMDEYYVDNHSFLMDMKLIAKTVPAMLFSKGAY